MTDRSTVVALPIVNLLVRAVACQVACFAAIVARAAVGGRHAWVGTVALDVARLAAVVARCTHTSPFHSSVFRSPIGSKTPKDVISAILVTRFIITLIIIPRTIFIVLSIRRQSYARVHFESSGRKLVSARLPPTR